MTLFRELALYIIKISSLFSVQLPNWGHSLIGVTTVYFSYYTLVMRIIIIIIIIQTIIESDYFYCYIPSY
jgi:hypothetical protein